MEKELTVQELLFNDQPVVINRKLAKCLGLKEAVIFQQIHYWLEINKRTKNNFKENKYWTYNSVKAWHENEFDFLSLRTVERTLQKLEKDGLLESKVFNKMAGDKTKWYTINYDKLLEVCNKKLSEKEILSSKRKDAGIKGAKAKASKMDSSESIQPTWQNGDPYNQLGRTIQPTWQNDTTNLAEAIPEITTETSTKISFSNISNSSKGENSPISFQNRYEKIIGKKLGVTTLPKFQEHIKNFRADLIESILVYAEETNARTYQWFEDRINDCLRKGITTGEQFTDDINAYREKQRQAKNRAIKEKEEAKNLDNAIEAAQEREIDEVISKEIEITDGIEVLEIKENIKDIVSSTVFNAWIAPNRFLNVNGDIVMVCRNELTKGVIERKYYSEICNILKTNGFNEELVLNVENIQ
jgi:conjugative transposon protein